MASWREQLYPASFRGVPFYVRGGDGLLGRRVQKHEFILRDFSEPEDLGGIGQEYSVNAFVVGTDFADQRERLIDALNQEGPGQLVHPRLGVMTAQVGPVRWRFELKSKEFFSITFYRVQPPRALSDADTAAQLASQADTAQAAVAEDFADRFSVNGALAFVSEAAQDLLGTGMDTLRNLTGEVQLAITAVSDVDLSITDLVNAADDLIRSPLQLATRVAGVVSSVMNIDGDIKRAFGAYRRIESTWGDVEPVPVTTPARQRQADNQAAMADLFVATAAIEAARFIATQAAAIDIQSNDQSPFASADDAYELRDELVATLDAIAPQSSDQVYREIRNLQARLVKHVDAHGNSLPRVRRVTVGNTVPALVLAHRLYGDALRESDIVSRNRIADPLFVAAGAQLEVLEATNG